MRRAEASANAEGDAELVAKIASEIEMETEMKEEQDVSTTVQDYLENGPFKITDIPGQEDVILTRQFGSETITVRFSIADLNAIDPEADYQDRAMGDEEDGNSGEGKSSPEDGPDGPEEDQSYPARLNIVIEKPGRGALAVESVVQDGMVVIDNIYHYPTAELAHAKTAEANHKRQDLYVGPPFGNLDEDLQIMFERYLDERGINSVLALFVPEYIDMKEQKEYMKWLENVKGFVEA
jgi:complement component 1 Q subcomponent-binding protein